MTASSANPSLSVPVTERDHAQGPASAPITLVEYGDYECPYCLRAYPVVKQVQQRMGDRLRFVFRNFPMNSVHPHAAVAAQAAEAAAAQGKFWTVHDLLYENQDELAEQDLARYALKAGLELYQFNADLSSGRFERRVKEDYEGGLASGVSGTPTFFLNGHRYQGAIEVEAMLAAFEAAATP